MKRLYIDMDNVLVDFQSGLDQVSEETKAEYAGRLDEIPGLFAKMKPMPGAIEAVHKLAEVYDVFILSTAPWKNPSAWSDKVTWVTKYLDDVFHKRLVITHHKDLCQGDYLIDDRGKNGTSEFGGKWIQFGSERFPDWESVLKYLTSRRLDEYMIEIGSYDLYILSTAPWNNPSAWSDKVEWVKKYVDDVFYKKMIITHCKDLCQGDYLIDDRGKNGTSEFCGEWIEFGSEKFPDWESVLKYLESERLDEYLVEIGRTDMLTLEEELALSKAIQEKGPDCEEAERLVKCNQRFVISVAAQYQKQGLTLEELIEAGNEGLKKAAIKYDASRGFKFISYAVWWIRQSIIQALEEKKQ